MSRGRASYVARFLAPLLLMLLGTLRPVSAQDVTAKLGVARTVKSTILNEDRRVLVHLPASYDTSAKSYPVLYLLDGTHTFLKEILQGQSLSGLFTIYALLARPTAFNAYIGCSAGWFAETTSTSSH